MMCLLNEACSTEMGRKLCSKMWWNDSEMRRQEDEGMAMEEERKGFSLT